MYQWFNYIYIKLCMGTLQGDMYPNEYIYFGYTPSPCNQMCRVMFLLAGGGGGGG